MTTKSKQTKGLIFGIISLVLPTLLSIISRAIQGGLNTTNPSMADAEKAVGTLVFLTIMSFVIYAAATILGIIGIITSSGASKEAKAAGEPKTLATVGLILSIVGTVFGGIGFLFCSTCLACTTCASCKLVQAAKAM